MDISIKTNKQLRTLYGVSQETFNKWLAKVPNLERKKKQRNYSPNEVKLILNHLGQP